MFMIIGRVVNYVRFNSNKHVKKVNALSRANVLTSNSNICFELGRVQKVSLKLTQLKLYLNISSIISFTISCQSALVNLNFRDHDIKM